MKFAGIESPEEVRAAAATGRSRSPTSEARKLDEDEYFLHDLVGLTLVDAEGRERGKVVEIEAKAGGGVLLSVDGRDGAKFDVPFAAEICTEGSIETMRSSFRRADRDVDRERSRGTGTRLARPRIVRRAD